MRTLVASLFGLVVLVSMPIASAFAADTHQFPYAAIVQTNEVEVRSGPGQRYYVTGRVKLNDKVTVHRHDPGGWYMIAPPVGSFSWIDASVVRRTEGDRGVVEVPQSEQGLSGRAIVRIGSEFSDDHSYYGRELTTGDEVRILAEKTLSTDHGAVRMYQIAPPALEYRWVKGDFIVPEGGAAAPRELFPVNSPAIQNSGVVNAGWQTESPDPFKQKTSYASAAAPPAASVLGNAAKLQMAELDQRYVEMTRQLPEHWDLDGLQSEYEALRGQADSALSQQIDRRVDALSSRRKIWTEWQDFVRLTSETSQRDAALAAMQAGGTEAINLNAAQGHIGMAPPTAGPTDPSQGLAMSATSSTSVIPPAQVMPRLDGAGIVQRMPSGRRGHFLHVLSDQQGRVLATLEAGPGINLDNHIGRPAGVVGQRSFDPRTQSDVIVVRQILPVQLNP